MGCYATLHPSTVEEGWWSGTFWSVIGGSAYEAGHVFERTREEAVAALDKFYLSYTEKSIYDACECGGRKVGFKPFEAGHSHWCPVACTR